MPFTIEDPTEAPSRHGFGDVDAVVYSHPAFAQVRIARVTGDRALYGSDFAHMHFIELTLSRSTLHRRLNQDTYHAEEELVKFALSEAQWATLLSSMNIYAGVPCTLNHIGGKQMPGLPLRQQLASFKAELRKKVSHVARMVTEAKERVLEVLGPNLSQAKRKAVLEPLDRLDTELRSNLPYVVESLEEHMNDTIERARLEINTHIAHATQQAGAQALAASGQQPLLRLGGVDRDTTGMEVAHPDTHGGTEDA